MIDLGKRSRTAVFLALLLTLLCETSTAQSVVARKGEIDSHLHKAQDALKANSLETAVKEFRAILALDPGNIEAQANLGVIDFFQGDCQSASRYFRSALATDPSLSKTEALLGICEKRLGNASAQPLLEKSFSALKEPKLRAQVGMELVGIYYQQGDLHRAASLMRTLVELDPDNVDVLYFTQRLYTELADDTLNKMAVIAPSSARMQQVIAERLVNAGDLAGAIEHYRKALEIDGHLPGIRYELSQALLESSPSDANVRTEAESLLQAAVKMEGPSAIIESLFGRIALLASNTEEAYAHYTRALALNPKEVQAQLGLAQLLMIRNKPEEAVKFLRLAIETDPLNGEAHYRLSLAYRRIQSTEQAQKEMRLFQDIKKTRDQVRELYRQMNKQLKADASDAN